MIIQYIRNKKNQRIGVLVADKNSFGEIRIGWSLCNKRDKFDKTLGLKIAQERYYRDNRAVPLTALIAAHFIPSTSRLKSDKAWVWPKGYTVPAIVFPRSIIEDVVKMGKRAQRYFKA